MGLGSKELGGAGGNGGCSSSTSDAVLSDGTRSLIDAVVVAVVDAAASPLCLLMVFGLVCACIV